MQNLKFQWNISKLFDFTRLYSQSMYSQFNNMIDILDQITVNI